ncbi:MAG: sialate O-acetylesterase [Victivallaceae bacterium]
MKKSVLTLLCCLLLITVEATEKITPVSVTLDGRSLKDTQYQAVFDGSLRDTPNLRTAAQATIELRFDVPVKLGSVEIHSGYRANTKAVSSAMSIASAKLEGWTGETWLPLGKLEAPVTNPELLWEISTPGIGEISALRLTITDSTDTAKRQDGQVVAPNRRGVYLREIIVKGATSYAKVIKAPSPASLPALQTPVILLIGQSNMDGRNDIASVPAVLQGINPTVRLQYNDTSWRQLRPGNSGLLLPSGIIFFGPEISFGAEIPAAFPDRKTIYLLKSSRGGTSMSQWRPPGGEQYQLLIKRLNKLLADTTQDNPDVVGAVWMQGESDSTETGMAEQYEENLTGMIAALRRELGKPELPFVIGQVYIGRGELPHNGEKMKLVHDAQQRIADRDKMVALVVTDDLKLKDQYHYDPISTIDLGKRFAATLKTLLEKP